jgi:hypothetical protein
MCGANMKTAAASSDGMPCPADTDKDGKVTKEEFMTHHEAMFTEADANKDGSLDADERKALHSKMMEGKCGAAQADDAAKPAADAAAPAAAPAATDKPAEEKK